LTAITILHVLKWWIIIAIQSASTWSIETRLCCRDSYTCRCYIKIQLTELFVVCWVTLVGTSNFPLIEFYVVGAGAFRYVSCAILKWKC